MAEPDYEPVNVRLRFGYGSVNTMLHAGIAASTRGLRYTVLALPRAGVVQW